VPVQQRTNPPLKVFDGGGIHTIGSGRVGDRGHDRPPSRQDDDLLHAAASAKR
jgi:hypothetical protein